MDILFIEGQDARGKLLDPQARHCQSQEKLPGQQAHITMATPQKGWIAPWCMRENLLEEDSVQLTMPHCSAGLILKVTTMRTGNCCSF